MEKNKEFKSLGMKDKMLMSEKLGAKVAIIINKTRDKVNKLLSPTGYGVNINVDFYRVDQIKDQSSKDKEVTSG